MGISTHILNTTTGKPAVEVNVSLVRVGEDREWQYLNRALTDADGRCRSLLPASEVMTSGVYVVQYDTAAYYATQGVSGLYPYVHIAFVVDVGQPHYHIPLLLTANGYTTYRGS